MIKDEKKIGKFKEWLPYFRWFLGFHIRFRLLMMFGILLGLNFVIAFLFIYYLPPFIGAHRLASSYISPALTCL